MKKKLEDSDDLMLTIFNEEYKGLVDFYGMKNVQQQRDHNALRIDALRKSTIKFVLHTIMNQEGEKHDTSTNKRSSKTSNKRSSK